MQRKETDWCDDIQDTTEEQVAPIDISAEWDLSTENLVLLQVMTLKSKKGWTKYANFKE